MKRLLGSRPAAPRRGRLSNPAERRSWTVPPTFDRAKGGVASASVALMPSFADKPDAALEVAGLGPFLVATAYGGDNFVIVDAHALGFSITTNEARDIAEPGVKITAATDERLGSSRPEKAREHFSFRQTAAPVETREA